MDEARALLQAQVSLPLGGVADVRGSVERAEKGGLLESLGVGMTDRGNVARGSSWDTDVDGVFVCGDMGRGQSLIVWAIAEGRSCAASVDSFLMGSTLLPAPLVP